MKTSAKPAASIIAAGLMAAAGCGTSTGSGSRSSTDPIKSVAWDLRKPADIKTLGLPENTVDLPDVNVSITLSDGEVYSAQHVDLMIDGDLQNPTRITTIRVGLGAQTIDQAYQTAKALGARWHIPAAQIDLWYKTAKKYPSYNGDGAGGNTLPGGTAVGLFMPISGDDAKPVLPEFTIENDNGSDLGSNSAAAASRTPTAPTSE